MNYLIDKQAKGRWNCGGGINRASIECTLHIHIHEYAFKYLIHIKFEFAMKTSCFGFHTVSCIFFTNFSKFYTVNCSNCFFQLFSFRLSASKKIWARYSTEIAFIFHIDAFAMEFFGCENFRSIVFVENWVETRQKLLNCTWAGFRNSELHSLFTKCLITTFFNVQFYYGCLKYWMAWIGL